MATLRRLRILQAVSLIVALAMFAPSACGEIVREWWLGIPGGTVADLTGDRRFPHRPDGSELLDAFEGPTNWADEYGSRLYGWLVAPQSGDYIFWIASADNSQLWLSTDEDRANKQLIAFVDGWTGARRWDKFPSQKSQPITLRAGRKYYIEALMNEETHGDNIAVAWQPPGGAQVVIGGEFVDSSLSRQASDPSPANDTVLINTWATLSWQPGARAILHEVYLSTDSDAVALRDSSALLAVTDEPSTSVGRAGHPFPDGLQTGTIYYWCVDEVNDAEPDSPWRGEQWSFLIPPDPVAYLLITNAELAPAFQPLVDRRTAQGYPGRLITVADICEHYLGVDEPEQIRNCIIDYYLNHGLSYVALGGDESVIPIRYCYPISVDVEMPADLYYADVDGGDWDANGNGIYGQVGDVTEVELTPEVHLGRIAVRTAEDVTAYFGKLVTYETASPEGFASSMLCFGNFGGILSGTVRWANFDHHDPVTNTEWHQMSIYDTYIQPHWQAVPLDVLWDTYSSWDTARCGDYELTLDHVSQRLDEGYHFMFYCGHAGSDGWAMLGGRRFTEPRVAALTNPIPGIVISIACAPAGFDRRETCVSEAFLRNPKGGAVAYFGHVRSTTTLDRSTRELFPAMFRDHATTTGEAMSLVKATMAPIRVDFPQELYNFVLHGDPGIQLLPQESGRHLYLFRPKGCEVIEQGSDLLIQWNAAGTGFVSYEAVRLEYAADSGETWSAIPGAEMLPYNGGALTWQDCPLPAGSHYRIRVSSLTDPSVWSMSGRDFTIAKLCYLSVRSAPDTNVVITGTYDGVTTYSFTTDYDISVPHGTTVSLSAPWVPQERSDLVFARWKEVGGSTLADVPDCTFPVSRDMSITAEYEEPTTRQYYINDETAENGIAPGDDDNDGRSPDRPMRHIQALLEKYPRLGGASVVNLSAGVYEENISLSADNIGLQLIGAGRDLTIIDGRQKGSCISLDGFRDGVISSLTMRNGSGAIWCVSSALKISDCTFRANSGAGGGAILIDRKSSAEISNCVFAGNSGNSGGGIAVYGTARIESCRFEGNSTATWGGGIYLDHAVAPEIARCSFTGNSSMFGGALYMLGGTATVDSCRFEAGRADRDGGAVCTQRDCAATFTNCIFHDNEAGRLGGALTIRTEPSDIAVVNCTFSRNRTGRPGGALYAAGSLTVTATNCIFWANTPDQIEGGASVTYSDVQGGWPGLGNVDADPLFADVEGGDVHLKSQPGRWFSSTRVVGWVTDNATSPCVDAGDPDMAVSDEPEPNGGRINMGAYGGTAEASKSP